MATLKYEVYGLSCLCHPADGIRYVGQTVVGLRQRLSVHRAHSKRGVTSHVCNWIRKHGLKNVEIQLIEGCASGDHLNEREIYWIAWFRSIKGDMLNIIEGGGTGHKRVKRPEVSERMRGENNPMYGKDRSELMTYARSFQGTITDDTRAKMSAAHVGKNHTQESKDAIGRGAKAYSNLPETKAARSERASGASNPSARFTEDEVRAIRAEREAGASYYSIAKRLGCSPEGISNMCRRISWKHVE